MTEPIELEFSYTDEDLKHIWAIVPRRDSGPLRRKAILVALPVLIYQLVFSGWTWVTALLTVIVIAWTLDLVFSRRRPLLTPKRAADTPVRLRANQEGFRFSKGASEWSSRWDQCGEIHEGRDGFLITGKRPVYIPKRAFTKPEAAEQFRELSRSECKQFVENRGQSTPFAAG